MTQQESRIVLCIPGPWRERRDLVLAVAGTNVGYLFAGFLLHHAPSDRGWTLEVQTADPGVPEAFGFAAQGRLADEETDSLRNHRSVIYLICGDDGLEAAEATRQAAAMLIAAGGVGVKCETSGVGFGAKAWKEQIEDKTPAATYFSYTAHIPGEGCHFTCGMKVFGLPDAAVSDRVPPDMAVDLLSRFNLYNITETPRLRAGHTFSLDKQSPRLRLEHKACEWYPPEDLFHNPNGVWWLNPV